MLFRFGKVREYSSEELESKAEVLSSILRDNGTDVTNLTIAARYSGYDGEKLEDSRLFTHDDLLEFAWRVDAYPHTEKEIVEEFYECYLRDTSMDW